MKIAWFLVSLALSTASIGANYLAQIYDAPRALIVTTGCVATLALLSIMAWIWVSISDLLEKFYSDTTIPMYKKLYGRDDDQGQ